MRFEEFAGTYGLIVDHLIVGKWAQCKTTDKPNKKNGHYKFLFDFAIVQNMATMESPVFWRADGISNDRQEYKALIAKERKQAQDQSAKASKKAQWIISQCKTEKHAYLDSKGFKEQLGLVWTPKEYENLLVIPMRIGNEVVGAQLIDKHGNKKFLRGQKTSLASHVIGTRGLDIYCEGYATGLSIQACLAIAKITAKIHICFSAGNLQKLAKSGFVVADNDTSGTGLKVAIATQTHYWISDMEGEDFNDTHKRFGTFKASQLLAKAIREVAKK